MSMSCHTCSHIHGCRNARVAHLCDSFEYTPLVASREALVNIVGESAAITALRKQKAMATPEHPNTTLIKELVNNRDLDGIKALESDLDVKLPYLVMAASHITGDSTKIGAMLRSQPDKRAALVGLLLELSKELGESTQDSDSPAVTVEPVAEEKPKKTRRKRRTKAEIEAAKAAKLSAEESKLTNEFEERMGVDGPPHVAPNVDFDRAFNDILGAIEDAHRHQAETFKNALERAGEAVVVSDARYKDIVDRLSRVSSALIALEDQLMLTGMVLEPAVRSCFDEPSED